MTATGTPTPAPIAAPFEDPPSLEEGEGGEVLVLVAAELEVLDTEEKMVVVVLIEVWEVDDEEVIEVVSCDKGICARIVAAGLMRKIDVGLSQQWKLPMP